MASISVTHRRSFFALLVLGGVGFASNSNAQESTIVEGRSAVEPSIGVELRYDDNIFRAPTEKQSSLITVLSPGLLLRAMMSRHLFGLQYKGKFVSYAQSSDDNDDDHELQATAQLDLSRRSQLDFIGFYEDAHENRGSGLSAGLGMGSAVLLDQPDEYERTQLLGRFTFGATGTRGRLVFEAGQRALTYTNNRERTRFFDYDAPYGGMTFYFRVMPNTSLVLDVEASESIYHSNRVLQPSLESVQYRYLVGATWDVTGKTTGTVKFGLVEKTYDDDARPKFSDSSWDVDIRWFPRRYSYFDFSTSRYPSEITSLSGNVIDNTTHTVTWTHKWTDRVISRLATEYRERDFLGSFGARRETLKRFRLTLAYEMRRWLTWEFGIDVSAQESNLARYDFDSNIARLGAYFTF